MKPLLNVFAMLSLTAVLAATAGCAGHNPTANASIASEQVKAADTGTPPCEIVADTPQGQAWVDDTIEQKVAQFGFDRPSPPGINGCPEKPKVIYADPKQARPAPAPKRRTFIERLPWRKEPAKTETVR